MSVTRQPVDFQYDVDTSKFGMWVFLSMEMLFFGALFFLYSSQKQFYPAAFELGSHHLEKMLAALNTGVLLTSSLSMAIAVHFAKKLEQKPVIIALSFTAALGTLFLVLKAYEYYLDYQHSLVPVLKWAPDFPAPKEMILFYSLYFLGTAIHATHLIIGTCWVLTVMTITAKSKKPRELIALVEVLGLYWHFVDVVWIFLFPLFYLLGGPK